jgi:hypothetical protein
VSIRFYRDIGSSLGLWSGHGTNLFYISISGCGHGTAAVGPARSGPNCDGLLRLGPGRLSGVVRLGAESVTGTVAASESPGPGGGRRAIRIWTPSDNWSMTRHTETGTVRSARGRFQVRRPGRMGPAGFPEIYHHDSRSSTTVTCHCGSEVIMIRVSDDVTSSYQPDSKAMRSVRVSCCHGRTRRDDGHGD